MEAGPDFERLTTGLVVVNGGQQTIASLEVGLGDDAVLGLRYKITSTGKVVLFQKGEFESGTCIPRSRNSANQGMFKQTDCSKLSSNA